MYTGACARLRLLGTNLVKVEKYGVLPDIDYTSGGKREGRSEMKLV